jgi:hypothetical protein
MKRSSMTWFGAAMSLALALGLFAAEAHAQWTRRLPQAVPSPVKPFALDIAYGNGRFLAGGTNGFIYQSFDGIHWSYADSVASAKTAVRIYFAEDAFWVLAGSSVFRSSDGSQWTTHQTGATGDLTGFAVGAGRMVAITTSEALVSSNGGDWVIGTTTQNQFLTGLAFGKGTFVASKYTRGGRYQPGTASVLSSSNGLDWVESSFPIPSPLPGPNGTRVTDVLFDGSRFVAVGDYQNSVGLDIVRYRMSAVSEDGKAWSAYRFPEQESRGGGMVIPLIQSIPSEGDTSRQRTILGIPRRTARIGF